MNKPFSFEFFPPRTPEAQGKLAMTADRLAVLEPEYVSVTFGAGGSTREKTFETVQEIKQRNGLLAVPHLSCLGTPLEELRETLRTYRDADIDRLVALRGDMQSGTMSFGELRYANELVEFIRAEHGSHFHIEVGCYPEAHPQSSSIKEDLDHFQAKVEAGADGAITQFFYNPDAYARFRDECHRRNINIPITAGVMPIINCTQLVRFAEGCGAEIPRWILKRLRDFGDDRVSIRAFGIDVVTDLCARLVEMDVPALHFYTLNQDTASIAILRNLGVVLPSESNAA